MTSNMKLKCNITGGEFNTNPVHLHTLIDRYGSEKTLRKKYICQAARMALKKGWTVKRIKERFNPKTNKIAYRGRVPSKN